MIKFKNNKKLDEPKIIKYLYCTYKSQNKLYEACDCLRQCLNLIEENNKKNINKYKDIIITTDIKIYKYNNEFDQYPYIIIKRVFNNDYLKTLSEEELSKLEYSDSIICNLKENTLTTYYKKNLK